MTAVLPIQVTEQQVSIDMIMLNVVLRASFRTLKAPLLFFVIPHYMKHCQRLKTKLAAVLLIQVSEYLV